MLNREGTMSENVEEGGFTLVELLVVILILGIIGAFTTTSLVQGLKVSNEADRRIQALTELQQAGERVSRELRMACSVEVAQPDAVVLDILRRPDASSPPNRYRYQIEVTPDGTLQADIDLVASDGTTTDHRVDRIAGEITNATTNGDVLFTYTDNDDLVMDPVVPAHVRNIEMTLHRQANDDVVEWTGDLHLRNGGLSCGF